MSDSGYVHGYSLREAARLADQADTLAELLHVGTHYPAGARVLECGCGTGAQTVHLAASSPEAEIVSVDIAPEHLERARERTQAAGYTNVSFQIADVFDLPFAEQSFDHVFVCFLLEHVPDPERALARLRRVLVDGGSITAIEGDHGSWYCHPTTAEAERTVECLIELQAGRSSRCSRAPASTPSTSARGSSTWTTAAPTWSRASPRTPSSPWSKGCASRRSSWA